MDDFLRTYNLEDLMLLFTSHGIDNEEFFMLENHRIQNLLVGNNRLLDFVSSFNYHKGLLKSNCDVIDETMDIEFVNNTASLEESDLSNSVIVESTADTFTYKETDLFNFLNAPKNIDGHIILGKYRKTKTVDYYRLVHILIINEIGESAGSYNIGNETFLKLRDSIVELFATEDPEVIYRPYTYNSETKEVRSSSGYLYSHYKLIRKQARLVGIIFEEEENDLPLDSDNEANPSFKCLISTNEECDSNDILNAWNISFNERNKCFQVKEKEKITALEKYLRSFTCLCHPNGIILLELDFENIIKEKINKKELNPVVNYKTLFKKWSNFAPKILLYFTKSRIAEVKQFNQTYKDIIEKDECKDVLALLLLPYCISVVKTFKNDATSKAVAFTKLQIADSFISIVKDHRSIDAKIEEIEKLMDDYKVLKLPYVILCGVIPNITQCYVIFKSEKYSFSSPILAVETCFHCLVALRSWPYMCDHVWAFLAKLIFFHDFNLKTYAAGNKIICDLMKM